MRAFLKNYRQAPRKVRLIARVAIGKRVDVAMTELSFLPNKSSKALRDLIHSASANARQEFPDVTPEDLIVKNITVDKGITYVRYMPRAFGRASPINRECSHVRVTLERLENNVPTKKVKKESTDTASAQTEKKETKETKKAVKDEPHVQEKKPVREKKEKSSLSKTK